jgi:hypothetical protein
MDENRIISPFGFENVSDLDVVFRGVKVNGLSQIKLALWNSGNSALRGENISKIDPFGFAFPDSKILDTAQILESGKSVGATVTIENEKLIISFDMLDKGDSIVPAVLMDTVKEDRSFSGTFDIVGKIEGLSGNLSRPIGNFKIDYAGFFWSLFSLSAGALFFALYGDKIGQFYLYCYGIITSSYQTPFPRPVIELTFALLSVFYVFFGMWIFLKSFQKTMRRPPKFVRDHLGLGAK